MSTREEIICITCPMGCRLTVTREGTTVLRVDGNSCKKGPAFAEAELTDPRRMVATTVRIRCAIHPLVPVYTERPFPRPRISELLDELRRLEINAPVTMNQVVLKNALNTGINVIASRDMTKVGC